MSADNSLGSVVPQMGRPAFLDIHAESAQGNRVVL
jgi:hypothetical protein